MDEVVESIVVEVTRVQGKLPMLYACSRGGEEHSRYPEEYRRLAQAEISAPEGKKQEEGGRQIVEQRDAKCRGTKHDHRCVEREL